MAQSKRQKALTQVDREKFYGVDEAISLVKQNATAKFDETVEVDGGERLLALAELGHRISPPRPGGPSRGRSLR